jgi:Tfp pilus assembly protein PilF
VLAVLFAAITMYTQSAANALGQGREGFAAVLYGLVNASRSYWIYLGKTFWPLNLTFEYQTDLTTLQQLSAIPGFILLCAVSAAAWRWRVKTPELSFGWFWYLLVLLPVSGIVPVGVQTFADRFTYLPQIGIFVALVWGTQRYLASAKRGNILLVSGGTLLLTSFASLCFVQVGFWKDTTALMKYMDRAGGKEARNPFQVFQIGSKMADEGNYEGAMEFFRSVIKQNPNYPGVYFRASFTAFKAGKLDEAMQLAKTGVDRGETLAGVVLGNCYAMRRQYGEAKAQYEEVLKKAPDNMDALFNLAQMNQLTGNLVDATRQFNEILRLDPSNYQAHASLAFLLNNTGDREGALRHQQEAERLKPRLPPGH